MVTKKNDNTKIEPGFNYNPDNRATAGKKFKNIPDNKIKKTKTP